MNETIAAISTALGVGAISIIRVTGEDALNIVNKITKNKKIINAKSHTINYDHIIDNGEIIDEVLISVMRAPKTFTMEDVVEINAHGGITTTNRILKTLLNNGCRLAEPGEFTKRAFLNGRIDLMQAEGIMDLINSKSEKARNLAMKQLDGKVSNLIKDLRNDIIKILANIEVNIDYPEYDDVEDMTSDKIKPLLNNLKKKMEKILYESENGKVVKEGIKTAIIGKPNVGKSSILNKLLNEEKAIVTDIEGTTRDIVEGTISVDGILLNVIDTAGIRETKDLVESLGVKKSIELINEADLILYVLNNNEKITEEEENILKKVVNKNHIIVINKCDLEKKLNYDFNSNYIVEISALNDIDIDQLKDAIRKIYNLENIQTEDMTYLSNARSISLLEQAYECIEEINNGISLKMPIDMIEIDIKNMWNILGKIIGETYQDALIDQLFSQFCLGK